MKAADIKHGDIARLKSGGPPMTVEGFHKDGSPAESDAENVRVSVMWIADDGKMHSASLNPAVLDLVEKKRDEPEKYAADKPDHGSSLRAQQVGYGDMQQSTGARQQAPAGWDQQAHASDAKPQSLGNFHEQQPAQQGEVDHVDKTDDPYNPIGTAHQDQGRKPALPKDDVGVANR